MNKVFLLLLLITISISSFSQSQIEKFEIIGTVSGFPDSSYIKLYDLSTDTNVLIDSAQIISGNFTFKGKINKGKDYQSIGIKFDSENLNLFWLENNVIHFNAEKGNFLEAIITGSSMQDEVNKLKALVQKNPKNETSIRIDYIKSHPNSLISGWELNGQCRRWGKDTSKLLYDGLSERVQQSEFGKIVHEYLTWAKEIRVGGKYANFTLPDIEGKNVSLSDYKGKYVLLDFWGSWCAPCRRENINLVKTYNEFKDKGFDILGVSNETKREEWVGAIQQDNIVWKNVSDLKGDRNNAVLIYGIYYYPANFLIDPNGIIIAQDLRGEALRNKLAEIL